MRGSVESLESLGRGADGGGGGGQTLELAERESCSAPSAHTRAMSLSSRLHPNKHLLLAADSAAARTWQHGPPPPSAGLFNVAASVIGDQLVDLSAEFFCEPATTVATGSGEVARRRRRRFDRRPPRPGTVRRTRGCGHVTGQVPGGRGGCGEFGDVFLPAAALGDDDVGTVRRFDSLASSLDADERASSLQHVGGGGGGGATLPAGTGGGAGGELGTWRAAADLPVTWPPGEIHAGTGSSRWRVGPPTIAVSIREDEERTVGRGLPRHAPPCWPGRRPGHARAGSDGGAGAVDGPVSRRSSWWRGVGSTRLDDEDRRSSCSSSSSVRRRETVRLHRSDDHSDTPPPRPPAPLNRDDTDTSSFDDYFTSQVCMFVYLFACSSNTFYSKTVAEWLAC